MILREYNKGIYIFVFSLWHYEYRLLNLHRRHKKEIYKSPINTSFKVTMGTKHLTIVATFLDNFFLWSWVINCDNLS